MHKLNCHVLIALAAACCLGALGCEKQQRELELVSQVDNTPLELDPTEHTELAQWWTNGTQLLRLNPNASYMLWPGQNRYDTPTQRGRWARDGYAKLWLEPYNTPSAQRTRVAIGKSEGQLTIQVPRLAPMTALPKPPAVIEDRLIGTWNGTLGSLDLTADGRYRFAPASGRTAQPIMRAGQVGGWSVQGTNLVLKPDAPDVDPIRYGFVADDHQVVIHAPDGPLTLAK